MTFNLVIENDPNLAKLVLSYLLSEGKSVCLVKKDHIHKLCRSFFYQLTFFILDFRDLAYTLNPHRRKEENCRHLGLLL